MKIETCLAICCLAAAPLWMGAAKCTNSTPIAQNDTVAHYGSTVYADVLANDTEPDGERLAVSVTGGTCQSQGSVIASLDLVRFIPSIETAADCTVSYRATDEVGKFDSATLTLINAASIFADGFESGTTASWSSCTGNGC